MSGLVVSTLLVFAVFPSPPIPCEASKIERAADPMRETLFEAGPETAVEPTPGAVPESLNAVITARLVTVALIRPVEVVGLSRYQMSFQSWSVEVVVGLAPVPGTALRSTAFISGVPS